MSENGANDERTAAISSSAGEKRRWSSETVGFCCALCSAAFYSVSLTSLRALTNFADVSSDWSIAVKELTTVAATVPFILIQYWRGRYRFPSWKTVGLLLLAGTLCQAVGARPHMIAYAAIGLALTTPLIQALQLIGTSVFGAVFLKEKVTLIKAFAIAVLIVAVFLLSFSQGGGSVAEVAGSPMRIGLGVFCACLTGFGYASQISIMRKTLRSQSDDGSADARTISGSDDAIRTPTSLAMSTVTGVGFLICAGCLIAKEGVGAFVEPPAACWAFALTAGVANCVGFFFQIEGLRRLYASKLTLVAASQTIALAVLGIVLFDEPLNAAVVSGLILVAVGVIAAGFSK